MGHMFWVMSIDAHSNGSRLHEVDSCSTYCGTFKSTFAIHGIPRKIVTDNGPSFVSEEFKLFTNQNGIMHITSALYHPSTNGLAESAI